MLSCGAVLKQANMRYGAFYSRASKQNHLSDCPVLSQWNKCGSDPDRKDLFTEASDEVDSTCADNAFKRMGIKIYLQ
ncbi:hypothetical protein JTB14_005006 [Gonioctena quinquepunctata]|nr:hypothetical protein JTB14_005006 [Gonioctena quinquepunctata]